MPVPLPPFLVRSALRLTAPLTGLTPIETHAPDDVFIVGFPKSGNTWCQYLLAGVLCGVDASRCPDSVVQELVPDVHDRPAYRRHTRPVFFKSHHLPRPDYRRVVHLLRDGRDAMVSYFHHHNALYPPVDFATLVRTAPKLMARWHEHAEAWQRNPFGAEMILVKYEDLHRDPLAQLRRICTFAGIAADDAQLEQAARNASFTNQKRREQQQGWSDPKWPKDQAFVRRGVVGSHRDEMPAESLAAFLAEAGPTLRRFGYPVPTPGADLASVPNRET